MRFQCCIIALSFQSACKAEYVTNEANFERPCTVQDYECIRGFIKDNSNCKVVYGPVSDPLFLKQNTVFFPFTNITLTLTDMEVKGLRKSEITEFYFNKVTNNLALAFEVPNLNESTPNAYFTYHRTAKESIVKKDFGRVEYPKVTFTVTIPNIPNMRLDMAEIHAFVHDSQPNFVVGPNAYESKDPDVIKGFQSVLDSVPIVYRETFLFQAQLFGAVYIQENNATLV